MLNSAKRTEKITKLKWQQMRLFVKADRSTANPDFRELMPNPQKSYSTEEEATFIDNLWDEVQLADE